MNKKILSVGILLALTSCSNNSISSKANYSKYSYNYDSSSLKLSSSEIDNKPYTYTDLTKKSLYLGSYPQTKVSDKNLISSLIKLVGTIPTSSNTYKWIDYEYYIDGKVSSYMYYIDIDYDNDGSNDYRGVYFTEYRPSMTTTSSLSNFQSTNGYSKNNVYWFKYEPIKWDILTTSNNKAFIISNLILDSQDYYYTADSRSSAKDYQGNTTSNTVFANNYMYSHIRSWLNTTFYKMVFNELEKQIIETTNVDNSSSSTYISYSGLLNTYACANTNDKVFLLSYKEATTYYSSGTYRKAQGSDYAKSQGLHISNNISNYWLRSPSYNDMSCVSSSGFDGSCLGSYYARSTAYGARPVCWINL